MKFSLPLLFFALFPAHLLADDDYVLPGFIDSYLKQEVHQYRSPIKQVRMYELRGVNQDGESQQLYSSLKGVAIRSEQIGEVVKQIDPIKIPDGRYHTLSVKLDETYLVEQTNGHWLKHQFESDRGYITPRIRGMILVRDGEVIPLRVSASF